MKQRDLSLLMDLERRLIDMACENEKVDIRPIAEELGLDIDKIMRRIISICQTKKYTVGGHFYCTKANVLPEYERSGKLKLDRDHVGGLRHILKVDSGMIPDY